jgi:hypothetical protein
MTPPNQPLRLSSIFDAPGNITLSAAGTAVVTSITATDHRLGISGYQGRGDADTSALFDLWIDGVPTYFGIQTSSQPTVVNNLPYPRYLEIGHVAQLVCTKNASGSGFYRGNIYFI